MPIWFDGFPMDYARERGKGTVIEHLGIELIEAGDDYLEARMPVDDRTRQPAGVLHGGASVVFAETLASWAATFAVDPSKHHCVGIEVNANHVRPIDKGHVRGVARPLHLGRTLHVWDVKISNDDDKLICACRITLAVLDRPTGY